jgi:Viral BACON domain
VTSDQPWLTASPLISTAPQTLSVRASAIGLAANTYTGHLLISASGVQGAPAVVTVTFVILPPVIVQPVLSVAPTGLTFTSTQGASNPASQTLNVANTGGGALAFTVASDQSWLAASPANGSAPQPITVSVANAGLTAGTYSGHITVTAPGVQGSPASITATFTVTPAPTGSLLFGSQTVLGNRDSNALGQAEAFQTTAVSTGTLTSLSLYVDSTNTAKRITLGLYTDNSGHPGTLLTQATSTAATSGAWNTLAVPPVPITTGSRYWIAILASSTGSFRFRDNASAACGNEGSAQTNLSSLPAVWTTGPIWGNCPVSGYGK